MRPTPEKYYRMPPCEMQNSSTRRYGNSSASRIGARYILLYALLRELLKLHCFSQQELSSCWDGRPFGHNRQTTLLSASGESNHRNKNANINNITWVETYFIDYVFLTIILEVVLNPIEHCNSAGLRRKSPCTECKQNRVQYVNPSTRDLLSDSFIRRSDALRYRSSSYSHATTSW